jgi:hypothetical protein
VQLGLILFLLLFSRFLGVSRKQVSFGISLGFGLFAGVELLLYALNSGGLVKQSLFSVIDQVTYNLTTLVWLGYSLSRNAVRVPAVNQLQTQRWEQGLSDLQPTVPSDSLIPMFESMVERAFSRSSNLALEEDERNSRSVNPLKANSAVAGSKDQV